MWTHKKYKSAFKAKMVMAGIDQSFQLTNGKVTKTYESWQAAVKDGWKKLCFLERKLLLVKRETSQKLLSTKL